MQDGLAVHFDLDVERRALEAVREVLLPREDIAARVRGRFIRVGIARVVPDDSAWQMKTEGDELRSFPANVLKRPRPKRRGADLLLEYVAPVLRRESVPGPREWRRLAQPLDVLDGESHLHEPPSGPAPRRAHPRHLRHR